MAPSINDLHISKQSICYQAVRFMECDTKQLFAKLDHLSGPSHKSSPNPSISPTSPRSPDMGGWVLPCKPKAILPQPSKFRLRNFASPSRAKKLQIVPKEVLTIESFTPVRRISRVKTAKFRVMVMGIRDGNGHQVTLLYNEDFNLFDISTEVKST